jgi:hypothetical protein
MEDFRHFAAGRWAMLHLRARGFAPLTTKLDEQPDVDRSHPRAA